MKIVDYLFYQYYKFQVKVGNADVAEHFSILMIGFLCELYFFAISFIIIIIEPKHPFVFNSEYFKFSIISAPIIIVITLYLSIFRKKRYKVIIKEYSKASPNQSYLWALLFGIAAFLLLFCAIFIKAYQNTECFKINL
jgi:hypothetical protein